MAVPDRFQKRIGETEIQEVLDRFLSQVVIDAEDRFVREGPAQRVVERARRSEIPPEGLFHHHAAPPLVQPASARWFTTSGKALGGMAR
jgi:hypothetical protein